MLPAVALLLHWFLAILTRTLIMIHQSVTVTQREERLSSITHLDGTQQHIDVSHTIKTSCILCHSFDQDPAGRIPNDILRPRNGNISLDPIENKEDKNPDDRG